MNFGQIKEKSETTELIRAEFESQGKIIDSYKDEESRHI